MILTHLVLAEQLQILPALQMAGHDLVRKGALAQRGLPVQDGHLTRVGMTGSQYRPETTRQRLGVGEQSGQCGHALSLDCAGPAPQTRSRRGTPACVSPRGQPTYRAS